MANNSGTAEFDNQKKHIKDYIGSSSNRLPENAINALATAELLLNKYAGQEYASKGFDYSCISSLYYQAVESMYNELLWSKYAAKLNDLKENEDSFSYLYRHNELPANMLGYLPADKPNYYLNKEKTRIANALTMGNFNYILFNATSNVSNALPDFKSFLEIEFGFDSIPRNSFEYKSFQEGIDELYRQIKVAIPKRNAASHGKNVISLEDCKSDKKIVLSDLQSIRNNSLGLILQFLSLYRDK